MTDVDPCVTCGEPHVTATGKPSCISHGRGKAHPERAGRPCRSPRMKGQTICGKHGGRAAHNRAAGEARVAEQKAAELVQTYGLKVETTPSEALLDEVKWTAGHVAWLRERVQELEQKAAAARDYYDAHGDEADDDDDHEGEPDDTYPTTVAKRHELIWGQTREKIGGDDRGSTYEAGAHAWLKLYQAERAHLVNVCKAAIAAGIEERKVKLAEQQGSLLADVIRRILADLNLTGEQWALVPEVVPRHLRAAID